MIQTTTVQPLRTVTEITTTGRKGAEIGPHCFWLAQEFVLSLECGHRQVRVRDVYSSTSLATVTKSFPKRTRCQDCPAAMLSARKPKPAPPPEFDDVAVAITSAMRPMIDDPDQLISWMLAHGRWIADDTARAQVHGAVALALHDLILAPETVSVRHAERQRSALAAWAAAPSPETADVLRKATRSLYHAQHHRETTSWYAARALVCLGSVCAGKARRAGQLLKAVRWAGGDSAELDKFYASLWGARRRFDLVATLTDTLVISGATNALESNAVEHARNELTRVWNDEQPGLNSSHLPALELMLSVMFEARAAALSAELAPECG